MKKVVNLVSTRLGDKAITQGESFVLNFSLDGDFSTSTPRGQIRSGFAQDEGELLAEFSFTKVFDSVGLRTNFQAKLSAEQTESIPYTIFQGEGSPNSKNCHIYDVELLLPNGDVVKPISLSLVQVKPEVTFG